jgi:hypothetical protein
VLLLVCDGAVIEMRRVEPSVVCVTVPVVHEASSMSLPYVGDDQAIVGRCTLVVTVIWPSLVAETPSWVYESV